MTVAHAFGRHRTEIVHSFHFSIIYGIHRTWSLCKEHGKAPEEPDYVASLVLESTPLFFNALNAIFSPMGISLSMSAVFCHQTPKVKFSSPPRSCELGDVLFVYVHTPKQGSVRRNALLFQAKMTHQQPHRIAGPGDKLQLSLYTEWPDFEYQLSGNLLNGKKRQVTPKSRHAGAQYLMIDDRPLNDPNSGLLAFPGTYPIGCCMADEYLYPHHDLASELFGLFTFHSGRPFEDKYTAGLGNNWSQVVWDLIEAGRIKSFNRKNSGRKNAPRTAGDPLVLKDGASFNQSTSHFQGEMGDPPRYDNHSVSEDNPESGVSVILIETSEGGQ